jgi:hypothetical protein
VKEVTVAWSASSGGRGKTASGCKKAIEEKQSDDRKGGKRALIIYSKCGKKRQEKMVKRRQERVPVAGSDRSGLLS